MDKNPRDASFGRLLKRLRKARDLTQEGLAQQAFCALDTIKKIESGVRRPSRELAEKFADGLALEGDERVAFVLAARAGAANQGGGGATPRPVRLPTQPTPFVGRTAELATLGLLLSDAAMRLVTIVGPGGMGKTRLAVALAETLVDADRFADGLYFVSLASLDSAAQIVDALAEVLAFPLDGGNQPKRSSLLQLIDYLRNKRLLFIFDNVEHLLAGPELNSGAGNDDAADLVAMLLEGAPGVAILATSRERLKLRQEHVYTLGGLEIPGSEAASTYGAVDLFVQRARRLRPEFAPTVEQFDTVARICRLVEGMPLAIELAAGWVDTLTLFEIAEEIERGLDLLATELRDVPPRHRNMRAVFDASYQRLAAAEQAIFRRLAILRGGGSAQALQQVAAATLPQLQRLIAASLLTHDAASGHYSLHELLRQYALEKLMAAPDEEQQTRDQHANYYCEFVQAQEAALSGAGQQAALVTLDHERENVRAALIWAAQRARGDLLARAMDALGYFCEWRAYFDQGELAFRFAATEIEKWSFDQAATNDVMPLLPKVRAWQSNFKRLQGDMVGAEQLLRDALAHVERMPATPETREARAFVLLQFGLVASEGLPDDPRPYLQESLTLYQELGRRWEASHALLWLGDHARYQGEFVEARKYFQASLAIRSDFGDQRGIAEVLIWDSHVAADIGAVAEAEELALQACALYDDFGDAANRAFGLGELSVILMYGGKYTEARAVVQESLELYQGLGNRAMTLYAMGWLAVAYLATGQYVAAQELRQAIHAQEDELRGAQSGIAFLRYYMGTVALTMGDLGGDLGEAETLLQESLLLHRQARNVALILWPLALLGYLHWRLGDLPRARAELFEVIQTGVRQRAYIPLLLALPAVALMLADEGMQERAVELYALAWTQPMLANAQNHNELYGRRLDAVVAALLPEKAAAAQARGREIDLWQGAAQVAGELRVWGWAQGDKGVIDEPAQSRG